MDWEELSTLELFLGYPESRAPDKEAGLRGWASELGQEEEPLRRYSKVVTVGCGDWLPRMAQRTVSYLVFCQKALTLRYLRRPGVLPSRRGLVQKAEIQGSNRG